jgi:hypothetical protein
MSAGIATSRPQSRRLETSSEFPASTLLSSLYRAASSAQRDGLSRDVGLAREAAIGRLYCSIALVVSSHESTRGGVDSE